MIMNLCSTKRNKIFLLLLFCFFSLTSFSQYENPPILQNLIPNQETFIDSLYLFIISDTTFIDLDVNDTLNYTFSQDSIVTDLPIWLNQENDTLSGIPTSEFIGTYKIVVSAEDLAGNIVNDTFSLTVKEIPNSHPSLKHPIPDMQIKEDTIFNFCVKDSVFMDTDMNDTLTYYFSLDSSVTNLPNWLNQINDSTISGIPRISDVRDYKVVVSAQDLKGETALDTFNLSVIEINDNPRVVNPLPNQVKNIGFESIVFSLKSVFSDEESESLTYEIHSNNESVVTCILQADSIIIFEEGIGDATVSITAFDEEMASKTLNLSISIYAINSILNFTTINTGSNGLVDNSINAVHEDSSGTLWFGGDFEMGNFSNGIWDNIDSDYDFYINNMWADSSQNIHYIFPQGLIKIENQEYTILSRQNTPELSRYILASSVDNSNTLWLVCWNDDLDKTFILKNRGNDFEIFQEVQIEDKTLIRSIYVEDNGTIWLSDQNNLYNNSSGDWKNFFQDHGVSVNTNYYRPCFLKDKDDVFWIGFGTTFYRLKNDNLTEEKRIIATSIIEDQNDKLWVGDDKGNIYIKDNLNWDTLSLSFSTPDEYLAYPKQINILKLLPNGKIICGTNYGLFEIDSENIENIVFYNTFDGLPSNNIWKIIQDKEDNLWIKTLSGSTKYNGETWEYLGEYIYPHLCATNGDIWCSAGKFPDFNSIKVFSNEQWETYNTNTTEVIGISTIVQNSDESIWIGGTNGISIFNEKKWTHFTTEDGLLANDIFILYATSNNNIWVEYRDWDKGTSFFDGEKWIHFDTEDGLPNNNIRDFAEDEFGNIWVATYNGLGKYDGSEWSSWDKSDGMTESYIDRVEIDNQNRVWVIYDWNSGLGISRFNGEVWEHFTTENGLPTNKIKEIFINNDLSTKSDETYQDVWLGSSKLGIGKLNSSIFESCSENIIYADTSISNNDSIFLEENWQDTQGVYCDTLINSLGCDSIIITTLSILTGLHTETNFDIRIFPNPTTGILHIEIPINIPFYKIEIIDMYGNLSFKNNHFTKNVINVSELHTGVYYIVIEYENKKYVSKLLKY
jgi:ligand-binding sensor domain-containing protein